MQPELPATMHAAVYRGVDDLRIESVPVPRIGPDELLVKVAICGVCPTDIKKIHFGTVPPPRIFGHETAGTIVARGARVRGFRVGDRVALHHHVPCLNCHACRHRAFAQCAQYQRTGITAGFAPAGGGFAQYARVMSFVLPGVVKVPARNNLAEAALLEPVNTVLKAVRRLQLQRGDVVWIVGQGPIGLIFTRLCRLHGASVAATDLLPARRKLARAWGAQVVAANASKTFLASAARLSLGRVIDAAVICAPVDEAVREAQGAVRGGGRVLLFAHTRRGGRAEVELAGICVDEIDLVGSYSADFTLQAEVARLVFSRRLDVRSLVTHRFPLRAAAEAVRLAATPTPTGAALKVVIDQTL